ncbi:MAG: hypothetical protein R3B90_16060 [Planctomycetaceae bacterium]
MRQSGPPSKDEIAAYENWLSLERSNRSNIAIPNELPWHSKAAVLELARYATELQQERHADNEVTNDGANVIVRLLTGSLTACVYDENLCREVERFLHDGGSVRIIVWNKELGSTLHECQSRLLANPKVEVRLSGTCLFGDKMNHFIVVDNLGYRREAPHPYYPADDFTLTSPEIPAQICFNDEVGAAKMIAFFDGLWSRLPVINIPSGCGTAEAGEQLAFA